MPINVDTISNSDGTGGPILSGLTTVSGALDVSTNLTVTGFTTISGSAGVVGILTADGFDVTGVATVASFGGVQNISAGSSITVGNTFILSSGAIGLGTTTTTGRNAGVGTAIGTLIYNETIFGVQVYDGTQWVNGLQTPFSATGGTESTTSRSGYKVHTFTSPGTFTVASGSKPGTVEYLIIAGGGGGASGFPNNANGGGGGAGGMRSSTTFPVSAGAYTIQVGGGGASALGPAPSSNTPLTISGTPSFITNPGISSITSLGGGGGAHWNAPNNPVPSPGSIQGTAGIVGSGGGRANNGPSAENQGYGIGTPGQGNPGGNSNDGQGAGGGGGAGTAGSSGAGANPGGAGGNGAASSINGTSTTYAGGGGGGSGSGGAGGAGGPGGGGAGGGRLAPGQGDVGTPGTTNTGGGGGGAGAPSAGNPSNYSGAGGSGIVIIAYPTS